MVVVKIIQIGNSKGIRIPKQVLEEFDLDERLGNGGCCSECGGNKWMLLAKESVAVTQGGKPYIECLDCGSTTHL